MLVFTSSFFLVEIVVGYVTNSIALVADSFHMLSDVVALIVGFASIRVSNMLEFCVRMSNIQLKRLKVLFEKGF